jgi:hypothetical protein
MTTAPHPANPYLLAGAALSAIAASLHLACIYFGAPWYRAMGAGEQMAQMADAGNWRAAAITLFIAAALSIAALYALSGAGVLGKLPLPRVALVAITTVYLLRGLIGLPLIVVNATPERSASFWLWSSAICLALGLVHLIGLRQIWARL